ncbi:hypothetical protein [Pendulispora albinea]|uniref:hypothetical protein n=1 Tax=Pendulispora albinea TaxID=2741071 RepID=UPI00374E1F54
MHTRPASAQGTHGRTSSLSWVRLQGAEGCIATNALAQAVESRLRRKVFVSPSQADVSVEGHVLQSKSGNPPEWRAVLTVRDNRGNLIGTREIEAAGSSCSALDDSLVLVVSILIDPEAQLRPGTPPPEPAPPPPSSPPPPPQVIVRQERVLVPIPPPNPWRFGANVGGAFSVGLLPSVGVGVTGAVLIEPPGFWGIQISGTSWRSASVDIANGARAQVQLAYGGVALCPLRLEVGRFAYRACVGAQFGSLQSRGQSSDANKFQQFSDEKLAVHAFLPSRFDFRLAGPMVASLGLSLIVPIVRTRLSYEDSRGMDQTIFQPAPVAGATDLSIALTFP